MPIDLTIAFGFPRSGGPCGYEQTAENNDTAAGACSLTVVFSRRDAAVFADMLTFYRDCYLYWSELC